MTTSETTADPRNTEKQLVRDPMLMAQIAEQTESKDLFGSRRFPNVYFPNMATVGQMMAALYWAMVHEAPDVSYDGEGITVKCRVKPDYVKHLIEDTLKAGGAFVANATTHSPEPVQGGAAPLPPGDLGSRETLPAGGLSGPDQKTDLPVDDAGVVDDLAMLVRRLVHKTRKANGGGALEDQAMDYLKRNGLAGSALRKQNATHPGGTTDVADGCEGDGPFQCHEFEDWWSDQKNGCPKLVLDNDKDFAAAVWRAALDRHSGRAGVTCAPDCWCLGLELDILLADEQEEPSFDPWALLVTPEYIQGRGQFSASDHKGYTNDWKKAGRFRRGEAEEVARRSGGKYVAIPLPVP